MDVSYLWLLQHLLLSEQVETHNRYKDSFEASSLAILVPTSSDIPHRLVSET